MLHQVNIALHVAAGTAGLLIGTITLLAYQNSKLHKRWGRYFLCLLAVVVATGFFGYVLFRSNPFLLILTLNASYVGYAGFRAARLKERRGNWLDAGIAVVALASGMLFVGLGQRGDNWNPAVIHSTVGILFLVASYDLLKLLWLHPRIKKWWIYEHIYKMLSAFSALLSAFTGNVLPDFQPYSQLGPSVFILLLVVYFIRDQARKRRRVV